MLKKKVNYHNVLKLNKDNFLMQGNNYKIRFQQQKMRYKN